MATCDPMFSLLNEAFITFSEVLTNEGGCWEMCKAKLQTLQHQWHQKGLFGANALSVITQYQAQIGWQDMAHDQFGRFYRFVFHICREPGKRNIQMSVAVAAWRLILPGRFRLLDRWCAFAATSSALVVTQDLWRQVLDFSRTVHEDLSNYDTAGSWAVLLDEFVEDMLTSRRCSYTNHEGVGGVSVGNSDMLNRRASSGADLAAFFAGGTGGGSGGHCGFGASSSGGDGDGGVGFSGFMVRISPRCGSKRREPDVDVVAEQLSAMPLGVCQQPHNGAVGHAVRSAGLPPVRQCGHGGGTGAGAFTAHGYSQGALPYGGGGGGGAADTQTKRQCLDGQMHMQPPNSQQPTALPQPFTLGRAASVEAAARGGGGGDEGALGLCYGGAGRDCGGGGVSARTPSGGYPMSCCTSSGLDSDGGLIGGPAVLAAMDCWLQDQSLLQQQQQLFQPPSQCQQRKAIRARRSGLSDIVKSAVTDALGF